MDQPVDCVLGETCYIQNYVDNDPSLAAADFACGGLTYDGHKGTDFALPTLRDMQRGVAVRAAAAGVVAASRDGMADLGYSQDTAETVRGRECGNGLAIDHGDGWVTQYCHMKRGTVAVSPGQRVLAGQVLGQVGLSGKTEFPHLHMSLRHNGVVVDPFAPSGPDQSCRGDAGGALWRSPPGYTAGGLVRLGFETGVPSFAAVKSGAAGRQSLSADAPALVLFAQGFGSRAGDRVTLRITGPEGFSFDHDATLSRTQALYFRAAGKKRPAGGWPTGAYLGQVTLMRDGAAYDHASLTLVVE
ncbi:M23 family metallopeptidase [Shimia sp.]|uniref:M23 family metallopeptidase n=1 Tax=Shimia sp. TaxID=1954381 RepID=UPI00356140BC